MSTAGDGPSTSAPAWLSAQRNAQRHGDRDTEPRQLWLDAWTDPVASVKAFSSCIHTCNLFGDGDWRLVVADHVDKKLKVSLQQL